MVSYGGNRILDKGEFIPFLFWRGRGWNLAKLEGEILKIEAKIFEDSD